MSREHACVRDGQGERLPRLLRGSLITIRRKCGKPGCRCADGEPHESPALSVSLAGRSVIVSLRPAEVPAVRAALARYQEARAELEEQAPAGVAALRARSRRQPAGWRCSSSPREPSPPPATACSAT